MGRRKRKNRRKNNKHRAQNRAQNRKQDKLIEGTVQVEFLKRDGDVALVVLDGEKYRIHKTHVYGNIGWIQKGSPIAVREAYLNPILNERLVVTNLPHWYGTARKEDEKQPTSSKTYIYGDTIRVIDSQHESSRFGLPIGTQFHFLTFSECPEVGDFVMTNRTGGHKDVMGYVANVDEKNQMCMVDGQSVPIESIGYKIINPEYLKSHKFANA